MTTIIVPDQDDKLAMCEAMRRYGGGFVKALAECFIKADTQNYRKLCEAFPEYVKHYLKMGTTGTTRVIDGDEGV